MNTDTAPAVYGWHFVGEYSNGKPDPIGEVRREPSAEVGLCGLHFSPCALVALSFAQGFDLQRVRATGYIVTVGGSVGGACNHAATEREALATLPALVVRPIVENFVFWCVEAVARPAAVSALRNAGLADHAATLEALPPVVDKASADVFRAAARAAARAAYDAAEAAEAAYEAADYAAAASRAAARATDATDATARAAVSAADEAARAAVSAANNAAAACAAYDAARERMTTRLSDALTEALLTHAGYNTNTEGK